MGVMSCESQYEMCVKKKKKEGGVCLKEGREASEYMAKQVIFKLRKNRIVGISKIL